MSETATAPPSARGYRSSADVRAPSISRRYQRARRAIDVVTALVTLPVAVIVAGIAAAVFQCTSPGPVLFRQRRGGYRGRELVILKLRTMDRSTSGDRVSDGAETLTSIDDPRVNSVARWLRRHHIDELPQLWHVITGEMAIIGPRPVPAGVVKRMSALTPDYARRLTVRPGLTGLAQVRMDYNDDVRGELQKLEYDLYYCDNMSPRLDFEIIVETVRAVVKGVGGR